MNRRDGSPSVRWSVVLAAAAVILATDVVVMAYLTLAECTEVVDDGSALDAFCTGLHDVWGWPLTLFPAGFTLLAGGLRPPRRVFAGVVLALWIGPPLVALALLP